MDLFLIFQNRLAGVNGVVVTSIVAIDWPRVRFAVNAFSFCPCLPNVVFFLDDNVFSLCWIF
jgi:hypothetical protein